jgi:hypothetical protein
MNAPKIPSGNNHGPVVGGEPDAEMRANYPHLKRAVYASLREQFDGAVPPLCDKDLEAVAAEEHAQPLEAFIEELENAEENS